MQTGTVVIIAGVAGIGLFRYGWRLLSSGDAPPPQPERPELIPGQQMPPELVLEEQQITLRQLSQLWAKDEVKQLRFDEISNIWRAKGPKEEKKERVPVFNHDEITLFYQNRVCGKPFFVGEALNATIDLLELLDMQGNCASVVHRNEKEPERVYDTDTYNMLARIPLYAHSLNVACAAMDKVSKGPIIPKAAIAALAHDLGKIPFYYDKYYKTSMHPSVGLAVAETLESLKRIKWFDEIGAAIKNHHGQSEEYLDGLIREADQTARRFEMNSQLGKPAPVAAKPDEETPIQRRLNAEASASKPAQDQALDQLVDSEPLASPAPSAAATATPAQPPTAPPVAPVQEEPPQKEPKVKPSTPPLAAAPPVEPERSDRKRVPRQLKDVSGWFEPERFIGELSKIINTTQTGDKFWSALTLGNYVYVKPIGFYGVLVRHSKNDPALVTAGPAEQDRDDYLYTVVMELKKMKDLVATEFLGGDRFGAVFVHNPGPDGTGTKQFLIPFRADFFGEDIARAESRRNTLMKKTVALVPAFTKGGN